MAQPTEITIPTQTFTPAQLLALCEYRIAAILAGAQAYSENGRQLTHADLTALRAQRDALKDEVAIEEAGANGGGNVLVRIARS